MSIRYGSKPTALFREHFFAFTASVMILYCSDSCYLFQRIKSRTSKVTVRFERCLAILEYQPPVGIAADVQIVYGMARELIGSAFLRFTPSR